MVCRNSARAAAAQSEIKSATGNQRVQTLIGDCSLASDVRRIMAEFAKYESTLDGVVCNAGAITPTKTITVEGFEVTLAAHLLHGAYLLTSLAMPFLRKAAQPRVIFVSSGGMYNTGWPGWEIANGERSAYNKELAYAYAKRGQVLLAEVWAKAHPDIAFASCHPGWVDTPGVDGWLGKGKVALAPLRTLWQGAEGIAWLCVCNKDEIRSGEFYLDRSPAPKHLAGPFFTEGSYTQNSCEEIQEMMQRLEDAVKQSDDVDLITPVTAAVVPATESSN